MPVVDVPFGEWLPSQPSFKNPGCEVADNTIPTPGGYGPLNSPQIQTGAVSGAVAGAAQLFDTDGDPVLVGGTDSSLFIRTTVLTETAGLVSIGAGEAWDFARFNDFVFATAINNPMQYLDDIDSDTSWSNAPGTPPTALRCAKVGEFLMLGWCDGVPHRIQWSAYNNPTGDWTPSRLTQANFADLETRLGGVQKIVGGRYAIVFQQRGIQRLTYVGPPQVWRADIISDDRGVVSPFSVVTVGYNSYFWAQDGLFVTNGASVDPVGTSRVNKWFFDNINQDRITEVQGAVDWQNESIVWSFHGKGSSTRNRFIIYSWAQNRFSTGTLNVSWVVSANYDGINLEQLDAIYGNLDSIPVSLDSDQFRGFDRALGIFNTDPLPKYAILTGQPLTATFRTGEFQPSPITSAYVSEVAPMIESDRWDMLFTLQLRDKFGVVRQSAQKAVGNGGFAPVRGEGKKVAVEMVKPSGSFWKDAQGVQVRYTGAGEK